MKPKVKAMWVAALRSGEYKQGNGMLRDDENNFCCLGVLCNLHAQTHPSIARRQTKPHSYLDRSFLPHEKVLRWAGLRPDADDEVTIGGVHGTLYHHNDERRTFAEIADAIEAQL